MVNLDEFVVGRRILSDGREELIVDNRNASVTTLRRNSSGKIEMVIYSYGKGKARKGLSEYPTVIIIEEINNRQKDYDAINNKLREAGL